MLISNQHAPHVSQEQIYEDIVEDVIRSEIPAEWLDVFQNHGRFHHYLDGAGSFEDCANLAAAGILCNICRTARR